MFSQDQLIAMQFHVNAIRLEWRTCKLEGCSEGIMIDLKHPLKIQFCCKAHQQKSYHLHNPKSAH